MQMDGPTILSIKLLIKVHHCPTEVCLLNSHFQTPKPSILNLATTTMIALNANRIVPLRPHQEVAGSFRREFDATMALR